MNNRTVYLIVFLLLQAFALKAQTLVKNHDFMILTDTLLIKKEINDSNYLTINYYHPSLKNSLDKPLYMGCDRYLITAINDSILVKNIRIDREKKTTTEYMFYDDGALSLVQVCHDTLSCFTTAFWPGGQLMYMSQIDVNGDRDNWYFYYNEDGVLEKKQFSINSSVVEEWNYANQ